MSDLNRYGQCPHCEAGWDGGDVLEILANLDVFKIKGQKELLQIANECYGYTELNRLRFTRLNSIDLTGSLTGTGFWECPTCGSVFNKATGERSGNMKLAINKLLNIESDCPF